MDTDSYLTEYLSDRGLLETFREDYRRRRAESGLWPSPLPWEDHMDSYVCRQAIEFLGEYDRGEPFCLTVGVPGPHDPMDPPEKFAEWYDATDVDPPIEPDDHGDWIPAHAREQMDREGWIGPKGDDWWRPDMSREEFREWRALYYAKISLIDYWVGELMATLDEEGQLENTIVIYTSDHGEMAGDHGLVGKRVHLGKSVRIPMLVRWPERYVTGVQTDALAELIDIGPTLLETIGAGEHNEFDGADLTPVLENPDDPEAQARDVVLSEVTDRTGEQKTMIATQSYRYAIDGSGAGYLLFDRDDDPDEVTNLIGHPDYEDVEAELRDRLLREYQRTQQIL